MVRGRLELLAPELAPEGYRVKSAGMFWVVRLYDGDSLDVNHLVICYAPVENELLLDGPRTLI